MSYQASDLFSLAFEEEINLNSLQERQWLRSKERELGEMFLGFHISGLVQNHGYFTIYSNCYLPNTLKKVPHINASSD